MVVRALTLNLLLFQYLVGHLYLFYELVFEFADHTLFQFAVVLNLSGHLGQKSK